MSFETRAQLKSEILDLIKGGPDEERRDALLRRVQAYQRENVPAYARLSEGRSAAPAIPTEVFRYTRVYSGTPQDIVRIFRSSGTTSGARGAHYFQDLELYDAAARRFAKEMLFFDREEIDLLVLAPEEEQAPDSSLSYMLSRFRDWFGRDTFHAWRDGRLDAQLVREVLEGRVGPIAVLGTSFAFVHLFDALPSFRTTLPPESRVMTTGGTKGKSRSVSPRELRAEISERFALDSSRIISEYGMTELSSQAYETGLESGITRNRRHLFPHWVRFTLLNPLTLEETNAEEGLLRVDDLANLDSVCSILTGDRARAIGDGFEILGRQPGTRLRGCSLAVEEAHAR